jgi:trehalose-6-phosphatase
MFENNDMYARLGKPYKFYMMFHGEHGCAKTSVIKAIASLTGKHVVVLRLDRFKDVIEMCRTITKFSSQVDRPQGLYVCSGGSTVSTMTIKRSDTRDAEKDVETASIETSVVMVDTKATTEAKKEHEAKKSALEPC